MSGHASPELVGLLLFGVLVVGFCLVTGLLDRLLVTAPLAFTTVGAILGFTLGPIQPDTLLASKQLAEFTLVLILFHDAAQVRPRQIGSSGGVIARLLLVGFPLTILGGYLVGRWLFPSLDVMLCLLLAVALAPTDAGLGAATVLNPVVPVRVRRMLNVESGINDGLATPVVMFAIAVVAGQEGVAPGASVAGAGISLLLGVVAGVVVGAGSGAILGWSKSKGLSTGSSRALALVVVPFLAYGGALLVGGNGFVAAFVAGTAFSGAASWMGRDDPLTLAESASDLLGAAVWLVFGIAAVPLIWREVSWREVVFGLLALTVLRMGPVALSLVGTGLRAPSVAFIGWFGPRGLASVIFALIALESLEFDAGLRIVVVTISFTVLVSVVAHGFSAEPLARRYGAWVQREQPAEELGSASAPVQRRGVPTMGPAGRSDG